MTISVERAGTEAELATFLAIGAEVHAVNARLGFEAEPVWPLVRGPLLG